MRLAGAYLSTDVDTEDLYFFPAEISNTQLDAYDTHMHESSLLNYAEDARKGVSVLDSHDGWKLGLGYSLTGDLERVDDRIRVCSVGYTLPGINFGGQHSYKATDDFIRAVQAGVVRDVSIGFHGGRYICDLCGGNYSSYRDCPHIAGREYEREGGMITCTVAIHDARLSEWSLVYDGATPDAMLLKAEEYAGSNEADRSTVRFLENAYRIKLDSNRVFKGAEIKRGKDSAESPLEDNSMKLSKRAMRLLVDHSDFAEGEPSEAHVETALDGMSQRINELTPLADDGREYRKTVVDDALAQGIRAFGDKFDQEQQRTLFESMPIDMVRQMGASWEKIADAVFTGGRKTHDEENNEEGTQRLPVPTAAVAA